MIKLFQNFFNFTPQEKKIVVLLALAFAIGTPLYLYSLDGSPTSAPALSEGSAEETTEKNASTSVSLKDSLEGLYVNKISKEELVNLPSIGNALAERIMTFRKENGPLTSTEDLLAVRGIGEKRIEIIKSYIKTKKN